MPYSLADKITSYLTSQGIEGARVKGMVIVLPAPDGGEIHRAVTGVVTIAKLDTIIAELKEKNHAMQQAKAKAQQAEA